jgi:hypothetical protein
LKTLGRHPALFVIVPLALALSACFFGDNGYWATEDELREALRACRLERSRPVHVAPC